MQSEYRGANNVSLIQHTASDSYVNKSLYVAAVAVVKLVHCQGLNVYIWGRPVPRIQIMAVYVYGQHYDAILPLRGQAWAGVSGQVEKKYGGCQDTKKAMDMLEDMMNFACTNNLEDEFSKHPIKGGRKRNYETKTETKKSIEEASKQTDNQDKPLATVTKMPAEMCLFYKNQPECTKRLPCRIIKMREWCAQNKRKYRCYKAVCHEELSNKNLSKEQRTKLVDECWKIIKRKGHTGPKAKK